MHVQPTDIKYRILSPPSTKTPGARAKVRAKGFNTHSEAVAAIRDSHEQVQGYVSDERRIRARILQDARKVSR